MPPPFQPRTNKDGTSEVEMNPAWQQLEAAALTLVRSGSIKDRLADAYRNHLSLVSAEDLPEGLRAEFRACHTALTREPPLRGEDAVRATVRKLSSHEADELACTVVRLFAAMVRESTRAGVVENSELMLNSATSVSTRTKVLKSVPQVISLRAAEG
jgi:hypothetical protein